MCVDCCVSYYKMNAIKSLTIITVVIAISTYAERFDIYNTTCDKFAKHLMATDRSITGRIEKEGINEVLERNGTNESLKELIQRFNEELWDVLILIRKGEKLGLQTRDKLVLCGGPRYDKTLNNFNTNNSCWRHLAGVVNETAKLWTAISTQRHYPPYPAYACHDHYLSYYIKDDSF